MNERYARQKVGHLTTFEKIELWSKYQRNGNYGGEIFINEDELADALVKGYVQL